MRNDEEIDDIHWFSETGANEDAYWNYQKEKGRINSSISSLIHANKSKYGHSYLAPRANNETNEG